MHPVRTRTSNLVLTGPPGVHDLHATRAEVEGVPWLMSVWHLTAEERERIAKGANIGLCIQGRAHPVVALQVTDEQGVGEDAPEVLARVEQLRAMPGDGPSCSECGAITQRTGACYTCTTCGSTTGCG